MALLLILLSFFLLGFGSGSSSVGDVTSSSGSGTATVHTQRVVKCSARTASDRQARHCPPPAKP